jgi:tRNA threonylcarbamoyladenosine biosynthesis protein TsaB
MKLLAFDTSSEFLSVALFNGEKLLGETKSGSFTRHSASLTPALEAVLKAHRVKPSMLGGVAVGLGPGSFTGLRVGVATAQIFAYAIGCRLAGVSSPAALAASVTGFQGDIVVIQDAKREKLYIAVYRNGPEGLREIRPPFIGTLDEALAAAGRPAFFTGDAVPVHREVIERSGGCAETDREKIFPSAVAVGRLALKEFAHKKMGAWPILAPLYLYPKDCNVTLPKKARA